MSTSDPVILQTPHIYFKLLMGFTSPNMLCQFRWIQKPFIVQLHMIRGSTSSNICFSKQIKLNGDLMSLQLRHQSSYLLITPFCFMAHTSSRCRGQICGTCCAPLYANLYLGVCECNFSSSDDLLQFSGHIHLWYRFIDVFLLVWDGPIETPHLWLKAMHSNEFNLTFTMNYSLTSIAFLDITISKGLDGTLSNGLFCKCTAGNNILHFSNFYPRPLVNSIPYSQYLRIRRNCSSDSSFKTKPDSL